MKKITKIAQYILLLLTIVVLAWIVPDFVNFANVQTRRMPFIYYSSIDKNFIQSVTKDKTMIRTNCKTGLSYSKSEMDSILPMLHYRQLLADGKMPDTIRGVAVPLQKIKRNRIIFKQVASKKNAPAIPIYRLFESSSGRVDLEMPSDFFRIDDNIEFIDPATNSVLQQKSDLFRKELIAAGFQFPAKLAKGNTNVRKPYEEGYFIVDNNNDIYQLKMVKGKPFVRNTNKPKYINIEHLETLEPASRKFYAFVFDKNGKVYIITSNKYKYVEIPCPPFDVNRDQFVVMGNMLYWNVQVTKQNSREVYAIDATTKQKIDSFKVSYPVKTPLTDYLFPFTISFKTAYSKFLIPQIKFGENIMLVIVNIVFLFIFLLIQKLKKQKINIIKVVIILLSGIYGFISLLVFSERDSVA